jgi:hypothetical protein
MTWRAAGLGLALSMAVIGAGCGGELPAGDLDAAQAASRADNTKPYLGTYKGKLDLKSPVTTKVDITFKITTGKKPGHVTVLAVEFGPEFDAEPKNGKFEADTTYKLLTYHLKDGRLDGTKFSGKFTGFGVDGAFSIDRTGD